MTTTPTEVILKNPTGEEVIELCSINRDAMIDVLQSLKPICDPSHVQHIYSGVQIRVNEHGDGAIEFYAASGAQRLARRMLYGVSRGDDFGSARFTVPHAVLLELCNTVESDFVRLCYLPEEGSVSHERRHLGILADANGAWLNSFREEPDATKPEFIESLFDDNLAAGTVSYSIPIDMAELASAIGFMAEMIGRPAHDGLRTLRDAVYVERDKDSDTLSLHYTTGFLYTRTSIKSERGELFLPFGMYDREVINLDRCGMLETFTGDGGYITLFANPNNDQVHYVRFHQSSKRSDRSDFYVMAVPDAWARNDDGTPEVIAMIDPMIDRHARFVGENAGNKSAFVWHAEKPELMRTLRVLSRLGLAATMTIDASSPLRDVEHVQFSGTQRGRESEDLVGTTEHALKATVELASTEVSIITVDARMAHDASKAMDGDRVWVSVCSPMEPILITNGREQFSEREHLTLLMPMQLPS